MKKIAVILVLISIIFGACGPKPYYKTSVGKKKLRFYNDIQYGKNDHPKKSF
jgi:hypothetical protein